jgi:hypothetical protein
MTATTHGPADLARRARQLDDDTAAARSRVAEQHAAAEQMAAEARAAGEAVHLAEQAARAEASRAYTSELIRLSQEVQTARMEAVRAVQQASDPLGAWLAYRTLRAVNSGRWESLKTEYLRVVGSNPPPGNWGPHVRPGPMGEDGSAIAENFGAFLTAACADHERVTSQAARAETEHELGVARAAAEVVLPIGNTDLPPPTEKS